jgi:sialic acid synthase SpsE
MSEKTELQVDTYNDLKEEGLSYQALVRKVTRSSTYYPNTGGRTLVDTDHTCYIVYRSILITKSLPKHIELSEGDVMCICAANGIEPLVIDKLVVGPEVYDIKASIDISAGTQSLFLLVIRK